MYVLYLNNVNNGRRNDRSLRDWHHNEKTYLCDLIPPSIQCTTVYSLRNGSDIIMPFCRISNTYDSFIPSTIRQWTMEEEMIGVFAIGTTTKRRIWDYIFLEQIIIQKRAKHRSWVKILFSFRSPINTYDSFIPSTIRQWNSLNPSLRNVDYIAKFKAELRKRKDISQVPKHYEIGSHIQTHA
jgi:hypothetical protein